ncbi:MAG: TIGR04282 family arsenosugar biosynthesis glycosyltransferase [Thermoleophilaceae bacterium]|nr:TIGR04282 family arsenosugar biosynthesis glycosyltransferase [Thermoleophilaceae bacterium]
MSAGGPAATALIVIAKAPVPGRSKTRLCPPCTPQQAADLAEAALIDTLSAVAAVPGGRRRLLVLEGSPGDWVPEGFEVHAQRSGGLDDRLAGAFAAAGTPAFLVGMDTPQLEPRHVERGVAELERPGVDAALGRAPDGGYWAIGLRRPDERVFQGVPMSTADTGAVQRRRLDELGLEVAELEALRDVDTIADAYAVAAHRPGSRFARTLEAMGLPPGARSSEVVLSGD